MSTLHLDYVRFGLETPFLETPRKTSDWLHEACEHAKQAVRTMSDIATIKLEEHSQLGFPLPVVNDSVQELRRAYDNLDDAVKKHSEFLSGWHEGWEKMIESDTKLLLEKERELAEAREKLAAEREQLEREKVEWHRAERKLEASQPGAEQLVRLNVGGERFLLPLTLLIAGGAPPGQGNFFAAMFSGRWKLRPFSSSSTPEKEENRKVEKEATAEREPPCYYLDRDPALFAYVIQMLREQQRIGIVFKKEENGQEKNFAYDIEMPREQQRIGIVFKKEEKGQEKDEEKEQKRVAWKTFTTRLAAGLALDELETLRDELEFFQMTFFWSLVRDECANRVRALSLDREINFIQQHCRHKDPAFIRVELLKNKCDLINTISELSMLHFDEKDVQLVMSQARCSRELAHSKLIERKGDIVGAIMDLM
jgi:hypothetical protein